MAGFHKGDRVHVTNIPGDAPLPGTVVWVGERRRTRGTSFRKVGVRFDGYPPIRYVFSDHLRIVGTCPTTPPFRPCRTCHPG